MLEYEVTMPLSHSHNKKEISQTGVLMTPSTNHIQIHIHTYNPTHNIHTLSKMKRLFIIITLCVLFSIKFPLEASPLFKKK